MNGSARRLLFQKRKLGLLCSSTLFSKLNLSYISAQRECKQDKNENNEGVFLVLLCLVLGIKIETFTRETFYLILVSVLNYAYIMKKMIATSIIFLTKFLRQTFKFSHDFIVLKHLFIPSVFALFYTSII